MTNRHMKNMNELIGKVLVAFIYAAVIYAVFFRGFEIVREYVKNQAVDGCIETASYTSVVGCEGGRNETVEPMRNWYEFCMQEKGYM